MGFCLMIIHMRVRNVILLVTKIFEMSPMQNPVRYVPAKQPNMSDGIKALHCGH